MARLRLAAVEYRRCATCGCEYAGPQCPQCGERPSVLAERLLRTLLIVDQPEKPIYERQERWRCRSCGKLYQPPPVERVFASVLQCRCGATTFTRADLADILEGTATPLGQAQRLVSAIKQRRRCRACGEPLHRPCWCPVCSTTRLATSSDLPYRPTWVYVPTGFATVSAEAAQSPADPDDSDASDPEQTSDGRPGGNEVFAEEREG